MNHLVEGRIGNDRVHVCNTLLARDFENANDFKQIMA
jgi:hypothetical protein